jgi:PKD repeat protein
MDNQSAAADAYQWMFGDGQTSTETNPSHTYAAFGTYTITLIATNECGNDTMTIVIVLSTIPNASFSYDSHTGCAPMTVHFIDQSQNDPISWLWTFTGGEPASSTEQNPVVVYNTPGTFSVSLNVENAQGADAMVLMDLINVAGMPDASFQHDLIGNFVTLFYPGTDYDSLSWSFGDGRTDESLNPTVEYISSGQYEISLTIFNACGSDTKSIIVNVTGTATDEPEINQSQWQIRPNPFGDQFIIYGQPLTEGSLTINIFDLHGKLLSTQEWNHSAGPSTRNINAAQWPSGMIMVQLQDRDSRVVLRGVHME